MALPVYSKADEKAMLYVALILVPIMAFCLWFGIRYNNRQVDKKLARDGVTVTTRVTDTYKMSSSRAGTTYYAVLDYDYLGTHISQELAIDNEYLTVGDTVFLRRLINKDAPAYMKIIGVRSHGVNLTVN